MYLAILRIYLAILFFFSHNCFFSPQNIFFYCDHLSHNSDFISHNSVIFSELWDTNFKLKEKKSHLWDQMLQCFIRWHYLPSKINSSSTKVAGQVTHQNFLNPHSLISNTKRTADASTKDLTTIKVCASLSWSLEMKPRRLCSPRLF